MSPLFLRLFEVSEITLPKCLNLKELNKITDEDSTIHIMDEEDYSLAVPPMKDRSQKIKVGITIPDYTQLALRLCEMHSLQFDLRMEQDIKCPPYPQNGMFLIKLFDYEMKIPEKSMPQYSYCHNLTDYAVRLIPVAKKEIPENFERKFKIYDYLYLDNYSLYCALAKLINASGSDFLEADKANPMRKYVWTVS